MDADFKQYFIMRWGKYFPGTALPVCYFYTDQAPEEQKNYKEHDCLIGNLNRVRAGKVFVYHARSRGCSGGKRFSGYSQKLRADFPYFLSCGIPGLGNGERYKKSPKLVTNFMRHLPPYKAPGKYLVFKRWDMLALEDEPLAVIFFAAPNVMAGLFTLANFDFIEPDGVIAPFGSGCASIIHYPYIEMNSQMPRCVLGLFDISARPVVPENILTFTVPMRRFIAMVRNMDESFLTTQSWQMVKKRLQKQANKTD